MGWPIALALSIYALGVLSLLINLRSKRVKTWRQGVKNRPAGTLNGFMRPLLSQGEHVEVVASVYRGRFFLGAASPWLDSPWARERVLALTNERLLLSKGRLFYNPPPPSLQWAVKREGVKLARSRLYPFWMSPIYLAARLTLRMPGGGQEFIQFPRQSRSTVGAFFDRLSRSPDSGTAQSL